MQGQSPARSESNSLRRSERVSRTKITRWVLMCAAGAFISSAALPAVEPMDAFETPLFELLGDNEIASPIIDDLLEIAGDVAAFLIRMVPGI
jgi:hypothetical protein